MGVLSNLAGSAGRRLADPAARQNMKGLAGAAVSRVAKTAWSWSGAEDIEALQSIIGMGGGAAKNLAALMAARKQAAQGKGGPTPMWTPGGKGGQRQAASPSTTVIVTAPNNRSQGITPRPLALPAPPRPSNQETRQARQVSAETREKLRQASIANAAQRAEARRANLERAKAARVANQQMDLAEEQLEEVKDGNDVQEKVYDELEAIHALMRRENNPLLNRNKGGGENGGGGGGGGGLLGSLAGGLLSRIPGIGGLIGTLGAGALGGKLIGKLGGLFSKIPGLSKLGIPGLVGLGIPGLSGFGGPASKPADTPRPSRPYPANSDVPLSKRVQDVTDVVGREAGGKAAGKGVGKAAAKAVGKSVLKKIPLIGALAGLGFGAKRAWDGDWTGAGLEVASGIAGTIPGVGTAASVGIDGALAVRDAAAEEEALKKSQQAKPAVAAAPSASSPGGAMRREPAAGGLVPPAANIAAPAVSRGALAPAVMAVPSSGAAMSWRADGEADDTMGGEEDVRVIDLLTTLTSAMLDRDKGIYVKPSQDVFNTADDPFMQTSFAPQQSGNGLSRGGGAAPSANTPTASPSQVNLGGNGFVPNSERKGSERALLGGGYVPTPRQDISGAVARDGSIAYQTPSGPTVGVKTAGGKFSGFGAETDGHIAEASKKYGIPEDVLRGFVKMEGGWNGAMSPTGAIGTGQFIQSTWDGLAKTKEGQEIGMTKIGDRFRTAADPRHDKRTNTLATGLLAKKNAEMLTKAGLPVTGENLYMMHNIGPGVINAMKGGPVSDATLLAMKQNGMKAGMTPQDFVAYQKQRYNQHYAQANSPEVLAKAGKPASGGAGAGGSTPVVAAAKSSPSVTPVSRPKSTPIEANAMALAASQRRADDKKSVAPVVVVAGNEAPRGKSPSGAAGDAKPGVVVRNNESSLSRVTDSLISRTIT